MELWTSSWWHGPASCSPHSSPVPCSQGYQCQASVVGSFLQAQNWVGRKMADGAERLHRLVQSVAFKLYPRERAPGAAFSCHCPIPKPSAPDEVFG